ncbi:hypothetical protein WR25_09651 [Diploscapter pachys]|uniref:Kinesin-like protein n=1 Tax=Diploscapter pachys TaxID=2018661 RepID=A0A2A2J5H6_9BILA|nr:hypothetical protein WR25_09651 [Diploscapter pachys]
MASNAQGRKRGATPSRDRLRDGNVPNKRGVDDTDNLEVFCRMTPYSGSHSCLEIIDENTVRSTPPPGLNKRDGGTYQDRVYEFNHVFDESDTQQAVFQTSAIDLVQNLVRGKNSLLFTYGITGSGKTYTMTGKPTEQETGILPRTLDVLFNSIENKVDKCVFYPTGKNSYEIRSRVLANVERFKLAKQGQHNVNKDIEIRFNERARVDGYNDDYLCTVFVSYVEIYNNYAYDLLATEADGRTPKKRDIRQDTAAGQTFVENATEIEVSNADEALETFLKGEEMRRVGDTILNKDSSRSHSVFTIRLVMAPYPTSSDLPYPEQDPTKIVVSQLSLVDLAGSERAKRTFNVGDRLAEAGNINKSLMVLRQCIEKLRKNQKHGSLVETVPYRDSKLTMLFKNYFDGSGKIRMIVCVNPKPDDYEENLNVLCFAEESQAVRVAVDSRKLPSPGAGINDANRPPVPRRFFSRWNYEVDTVLKNSDIVQMIKSPLTENFIIDDMYDEGTVEHLKEVYTRRKQENEINQRNMDYALDEFDLLLRNTLCVADFNALRVEELAREKEATERFISTLTAENKQIKREMNSMAIRLREYEIEDDNQALMEHQLRQGRKKDQEKFRSNVEALKTLQDLCNVQSPSVAALAKNFGGHQDGNEKAAPGRGKVTTTTTRVHTQITMSGQRGRETEPREQKYGNAAKQEEGILANAVPYFNPKYGRRSKSATRVIDHQPANRVPTGTVMQPNMPHGAKRVTQPRYLDPTRRGTTAIHQYGFPVPGSSAASVWDMYGHLLDRCEQASAIGEETSTDNMSDVFDTPSVKHEPALDQDKFNMRF